LNLELADIWQMIEEKQKCNGCRLRARKPLIFRLKSPIKVVVVTEGPNRQESPEFVASIANHPTYTFLYTLFGGCFTPIDSTSCQANVYWTHVRKCFLNGTGRKTIDRALKICSSAYLAAEIKAARPRLVVAVGRKVLGFFEEFDQRFAGGLREVVFKKQSGGVFTGVRLDDFICDVSVVPHPSGRNVTWSVPPDNARGQLEAVRQRIAHVILDLPQGTS